MLTPKLRLRPLAVSISLVLIASAAQADVAEDSLALLAANLDRMAVIGSEERASEVPGSAEYISHAEMQKYEFTDIHRALRQVPGVYMVEEEGYGLRPNIGIRGSGTDRNSRITVMEDGVLIAPAAYSAPAAYYFPTTERMHAIELRKGSASIKSGPRTIGGALNLISTPIPDQDLGGRMSLLFGKDSTVLAHANAGGRSEHLGWLVETVQQETDGFKRLDSGGTSGFDLEDYLGKFRLTTGSDAARYQELEIKLGATDQVSDETYLGLTEDDFEAMPNRRYAASQVDRLDTEHEQQQLRHFIQINDMLDLTTVAYNNEFSRAWYKLDSVNGRSLSAILENPEQYASELAWIRGETSADNALSVRNNARDYYSRGIQSVLGISTEWGQAQHVIETGIRFHRDEESRFQNDDKYRMENGTMVLTSAGAPGSQDNRTGEAEAFSIYVQDEIRWGDWQIVPGFRYEDIELTRTDYVRAPDGRDQAPTRVREHSVSQFIPGIGVSYDIDERWSFVGGAHKGFSPPSPGSTADSEESLNLEFGARFNAGEFNAEVVAFHNAYDNLVGTCTASTGGNCEIGDQFDGGESTVQGVEASLGYDFGRARDAVLGIPVRLGYTFTQGEFDTSFASEFEEFATVEAGDDLPYLPENLVFGEIGLVHERWSTHLSASYVDEMRSVAGSGEIPDNERTDGYWVTDLAASYQLSDAVELFGKVENLLDETYVASLRPAGARPGRPRSTFVGIRVTF